MKEGLLCSSSEKVCYCDRIIYIFAIVSYISREMWGGYEVIDCVKDTYEKNIPSVSVFGR